MSTNGKSKIQMAEPTTRVLAEIKPAQPVAKKKGAKRTAKILELATLDRKPRWASGTANIVERDGRRYLALTLDGTAFQVPNETSVLDWLQSALTAFAADTGTNETREIEVPIKAAG